MAKLYFRKHIVSTPVRVGGKQVTWMGVGGGIGVLELEEDSDIAVGLSKLAQANRLGVQSITAEEFEDSKKNSGSQLAKPSQAPRIMNPIEEKAAVSSSRSKKRSEKSQAAGAAKAKAEPTEGPTITKGADPEPSQ